MADKNLEYYIEFHENEKCFNLWTEQKGRYYNIATLFYQDPLCGDDWSISEIEKAVSYPKSEISDELESPLIKISQDDAEKLLSMKNNSPNEILNYVDNVTKRMGKNDK